jgi:hypothetical protein
VDEKRILMVEGKNDKHVVYAIRDSQAIPKVFEVQPFEGDDKLLDALPGKIKEPNVTRLAVILDADEEGIDRRWDQLKSRLGQTSPPVAPPSHPDPNGTHFPIPDGPLFSAWLMPDNRRPGMLEDFLAFLIPEGDNLLPRVDAFLNDLPKPRRFREVHVSKARLHCWLALQEEPGRPFGTAITARYLHADREVVQPFVQWLRKALVDELPEAPKLP